MSIFLIWKTNKLSGIIPKAQLDEGLHNTKILSTDHLKDPQGEQLPFFSENLTQITEKVLKSLKSLSFMTSVRILNIHLKPTLRDRQNKHSGYQHRPRLEPLKTLIEKIQVANDQAGRSKLRVLVDLGNPYYLRGFVVLDTQEPNSKFVLDRLLDLGTPDHRSFSAYHYEEAYLPLESQYTPSIVCGLPKSDSLYLFSDFKPGPLPTNEMILINYLKKVAISIGLVHCEIYLLQISFDRFKDSALVVCSDRQLFEKMEKPQRERLKEIAGFQKEFPDGGVGYEEFTNKLVPPRFILFEKYIIWNKKPTCFHQIFDTFEKFMLRDFNFKGSIARGMTLKK